MNGNEKRYIAQCSLYTTATLLISGSIIQAFLLENGISEAAVTLYLSIVQTVQVAAMFAMSLFIDRIKKVIRLFSLVTILQLGMFASLIAICLFSGATLTFRYTLVLSVGVATGLFQALCGILSYKVPYHIMNMGRYGRVTGIGGVVTGIACSSVSAIMSYLTGNYNYNAVMLFFFILGGVLMIIVSGIIISFKPLPVVDKEEKKHSALDLLKYRPFTALLAPNLLRGFCAGILSVSMTIGFSQGLTDKSSGAVLTLLMQVAVIISCFIYSLIARPRGDGKIILAASALLVVFMPSMLLGASSTVFYVMYFLSYFAITFIDYSVPVAVTEIVDYDRIGIYSSWRMLTHTLGIAIASALVTPMLSVFGGRGTFIIAAACQLISGLSYYLFLKKNRNCGEK